MRRLKRTNAVNPQPQQAVAVAEPTPMGAQAANAADSAAAAEATALAPLPPAGELLAQLGQYQDHAENLVLAGTGEALPYLGFHSMRSPSAMNVLQALGQIPEGTPYLHVDGEYYNASHFSFLMFDYFAHWCTLDSQFHPDRVWLTSQGFNAKTEDGQRINEQILSITLVLPGQAPLPAGIQPAVCTLTTWRQTKVGAPKGHLAGVKASTTPEWAQKNGRLAQVGPRLRVTSHITVEARTARGGPNAGKPFYLANAVTSPTSVAQLDAIQAWASDEACRAELAACQQAFEARVSQLKALAQ